MIRMEYPKANIEGLTDREKIYALKKQLDTLTNNVQLVLESIDGDIEGINEYIGGVPDELDNSMSTISERVDEVETAVGTLEERDYIVEQGTSGIWTYRKWDSGIAECWGATTIRVTSNTASGQVNFSEGIQVNLPFTMSDRDYVISAICGSYMMYMANYSRNRAYFTIRLCRISYAIPTGTDIDVLFSIKGRWK